MSRGCQNSVEDIQRAHVRIAPIPEAMRRVDELMLENPRLTMGDAIVQAESDFARKIINELEAFIESGAGYCEELGREFPIFKGWAPPDHPYPEAWTKGKKPAEFFQGEGHKLSGGASSSKLDEMD